MIKNNIIMSIDPGTSKSAFIFLSIYDQNRFDIIDKNHINNNDILKQIIKKQIKYGKYNLIIETIVSYGNLIGQQTIETAIWAGRFFQLGYDLGLISTFLSRPEVQLNLCNNKRAKPKNMRQALIDRFGPLGTKKNPGKLYGIMGAGPGKINHIWSALELAITFIDINMGTVL